MASTTVTWRYAEGQLGYAFEAVDFFTQRIDVSNEASSLLAGVPDDGTSELLAGAMAFDLLPDDDPSLAGMGKSEFLVHWLADQTLLPLPWLQQVADGSRHGVRLYGHGFLCLAVLYLRTRRGGFDRAASAAFLRVTEAFREWLPTPLLRLQFAAHTSEMQKQVFWDWVNSVESDVDLLAAAPVIERTRGRLFGDVCDQLMKRRSARAHLESDLVRNWQAAIGDTREATSVNLAEADDRSFESYELYSLGQLLNYADVAFALDAAVPAGGVINTDNLLEVPWQLPPDSAYLAYFQANDHLFVLTITRQEGGVALYAVPTYAPDTDLPPLEVEFGRVVNLLRALGDGMPVAHRSSCLQRGVASREVLLPSLAEGYDLLFREPQRLGLNRASLEEALGGVDTLYVSMGFPVQGLPLMALHNGENFQFSFRTIAHVPNAHWFCRQAGSASTRVRTALIIVDPNDDLDGARREGILIAEALERSGLHVDLRVGEQAVRAAITEASAAPDLFHYAGHADFSLVDSSVLHLRDGSLGIADVLDGPFAPAHVFLNGCRTDRRQAHVVEETLAISSAFLARGAGVVLSTLWPVDDDLALEFAVTYYDGVLAGHTVGDAYRNAMGALARTADEPAQWAPFVLAGAAAQRLETVGE